MAKIITKFRYSKPTADRKIGGYAGYIATSEGVEKIYSQLKTFSKKTISYFHIEND